MSLYATAAQRFGLAKESVRGIAETTPTKWYQTRGIPDLSFDLKLLDDKGIRGVAAKYPSIEGIKVGEGKVPLYFDAQMLGEFSYSLLGAKSSAEATTITISASNNKLDFNIGAGTLTATIPSLTYAIGATQADSGTLCKAIKDAITSAEAVGTYTVTYSRTTRLFTITRSTGTFQMVFLSGTNNAVSIDTTLGYTHTDHTGALTYASETTVQYAFNHTFSQSGIIQPPAYTFFQDRSLNVMKYNRGCVKSISLKGGVDNLVECDVDVLYQNEASGSIGSPSFPTQKYLSFQHVDFKIAGSSNTNVEEWSLKIDNGARAHRTQILSQQLQDILAPEPIMIDGDFSIFFDSTTERDKFLANTAVAIRILAQGATIVGSTKWTTDINIYEAHYKAHPYGEKNGLLAAKASFEGFYNSNSSKAIQIDLTNQDTSY